MGGAQTENTVHAKRRDPATAAPVIHGLSPRNCEAQYRIHCSRYIRHVKWPRARGRFALVLPRSITEPPLKQYVSELRSMPYALRANTRPGLYSNMTFRSTNTPVKSMYGARHRLVVVASDSWGKTGGGLSAKQTTTDGW